MVEPTQQLIHHVPQLLSEQGSAAGLGTLHAHVEQTLLRVERGVRVHDHAVVAEVVRIAPRGEQRVREEEFGIVPLKAQACGCPVITFCRCGVLRPLGTTTDPTGVFFEEQAVDAIAAASEQFECDEDRFDPRAARRQAVLFRKARFEDEMFGFLDRVMVGKAEEVRKVA